MTFGDRVLKGVIAEYKSTAVIMINGIVIELDPVALEVEVVHTSTIIEAVSRGGWPGGRSDIYSLRAAQGRPVGRVAGRGSRRLAREDAVAHDAAARGMKHRGCALR